MKTKSKTNRKGRISISSIFILSMLMALFNVTSMFAVDFDESLILKGDDSSGDISQHGPRSIIIKLENEITAIKNSERIKVEFSEILTTDITISIEKNSVIVYQTQVNPVMENTVLINILNFQSGEYKLSFVDAGGKKAYTEFKVNE